MTMMMVVVMMMAMVLVIVMKYVFPTKRELFAAPQYPNRICINP